MTTQEMIAQAHQLARKTPGYRYNPQVLESIITTGLPEGVVLATMGGQKALREGGEIICLSIEDNKEIKRVPLTREMEEKLLIAYAVKQSTLSTTMGSLA